MLQFDLLTLSKDQGWSGKHTCLKLHICPFSLFRHHVRRGVQWLIDTVEKNQWQKTLQRRFNCQFSVDQLNHCMWFSRWGAELSDVSPQVTVEEANEWVISRTEADLIWYGSTCFMHRHSRRRHVGVLNVSNADLVSSLSRLLCLHRVANVKATESPWF